jgi:uncharacterized membrane protein
MDITPPEGQTVPSHHSLPTSGHLDAYKHLFDGMHLKFPTFKHDHPAVINVNKIADEQLTIGQRIADKVAATVGSWPFIIIQSCILAAWIILNSLAIINRWDPYPFILLNLMLSFQAAYAAPFVMMSQNRQAEKDRLTAQNDYITDCKGEEEIRHIMEHLDHQDEIILQIVKRLEEQHMEMKEQLKRLDPELVKRIATDAQQVVREQAEQN